MKCTKWPFRPIHITNDGEKAPEGSPLRKLGGEGIIPNNYLQGIQDSICATLENPTTIMEFSPKGKCVRTDSTLAVLGLHGPCLLFRRYNNSRECVRCDKIHALLFRWISKTNLSIEIEGRIKGDKYIQQNNFGGDIHCRFVRNGTRRYVEYDCPLLGYRELLFPIFFENNVIGVFFNGELCLVEQQEFVVRTQEQYFKKNPDCFREYYDKCYRNKKSKTYKQFSKKIIEDIQSAHKGRIRKKKNVLDKDKYEKVIKKCCAGLERLESTLNEQMLLQRERYIRIKIDKRIGEFREDLSRKSYPDKDNLKLLWKNVGARMRGLIDDFAIRYVVVFGIKRQSQETTTHLEVAALEGDLPEEVTGNISSLRFNLDTLPADIRKKYTTSVRNREIIFGIEGFPMKVMRPLNLVRLFPVPFLEQGAIVILIGYHEWNTLKSVENKPGGTLDRNIESFYAIILSTFSAIWAEIAEEKMRMAMQHLKAEGEREKAFLLRAAHSISLPMQSISADSANLLDDIDADDQNYETATHMFNEVQGLQLFIQNVLHMEHKETTELHEPEFRKRSLLTLLKEACTMFMGEAADKGCDIFPVILADRTEVEMNPIELDDLAVFHMRAVYNPVKERLGIPREKVIWGDSIKSYVTVKGREINMPPELLPKKCMDLSPENARIEIQGQGIEIDPIKIARLYLPYVAMVRHELSLAFKNLIHNAVKYSYRTSLTSKKRYVKVVIRLKYMRTYEVSISNYGVGILKHEIDRGLIWEEGYRGEFSIDKNRPGAGLGLNQAKRAIESIHGGKLQVISSLKHRNTYLTTFVATVPISQEYRIC
jgi:signal transduction histidine kinase